MLHPYLYRIGSSAGGSGTTGVAAREPVGWVSWMGGFSLFFHGCHPKCREMRSPEGWPGRWLPDGWSFVFSITPPLSEGGDAPVAFTAVRWDDEF